MSSVTLLAQTPGPTPLTPLQRQAHAARAADKLDEAIALYVRALKAQPRRKEGWWFPGTLSYEQDRYLDGRNAFRSLLALDQRFGPAFSLLGLCEFQLREYEQALLHLRRGNDMDPGDNEELRRVARFHEAMLHAKFEQFEMAHDVTLKYVLQKEPTPRTLLLPGLIMLRLPFLPEEAPAGKRELIGKTGRAAFYAASDNVAAAQREYQELVTLYGHQPGVNYAHGLFLLRGDSDAAIAALKRELDLTPGHVTAHLLLAFEYLKRNEPAAGLPYAEQAVRLAPELFAGDNALGRLFVDTGQAERAIQALEKGVTLAPTSPEMHFALSRAYAKAGRAKDATRARAEFTRLEKQRAAQQARLAEQAQARGGATDGKPQP
ncbi:MAG: tetratricopeptide repeat protein [Blastocatellia bacterium]